MNTLRMILVALPMMLLLACGGGGGGGTTVAPTPMNTPDPMAPGTMDDPDMPPTTTPLTPIQTFQNIASTADILLVGDINQESSGSFVRDATTNCTGTTCTTTLPEPGATTFSLSDINGFSLIDDMNLQEFTSDTPSAMSVGDATLIQGTTTARTGSTQLTFQTYTGWFDSSVFGVEIISIGESLNTRYRFTSYSFGNTTGTKPMGSSGSATWMGSAVAVMNNRDFIRGTTTIEIDDLTDSRVDLSISNWVTPDGQSTSVSDVNIEGMTLEDDGSFKDTNEHIEGYFYGNNHEGVGGVLNNGTLIGAFGGTRQ